MNVSAVFGEPHISFAGTKLLVKWYLRSSLAHRMCLYLTLLVTLALIQPFIPFAFIRSVLSFLFLLTLFVVVTDIFSRPIKAWLRGFLFFENDRRRLAITAAIFVGGGTALLVIYCLLSQDIKVYEVASSWRGLIDGQNLIDESIPQYLLSLFSNNGGAWHYDFASMPLLIFTHIFGTSFTSYLVSLYLIYYLPTALVLAVLGARITKPFREKPIGSTSFIIMFCFIALNIALLAPFLSGLCDMAGVLCIAWLLNIVLALDSAKFDVLRDILIAGFLAGMIAIQQWYLFFVIPFLLAYLVYGYSKMGKNGQLSMGNIGRLAASFLLITTLLVGLICLFDFQFFQTVASRYFSNISSFAEIDIVARLSLIVQQNGILFVAVPVVGFVMMIRQNAFRSFAFLLAFLALCPTIGLCFVQAPEIQHLYLSTPILLVLSCPLIDFAVRYAYRTIKPLLAIIICAVVGIGFLFSHVPFFSQYAWMLKPYVSIIDSYPPVDSNYRVFKLLADEINGEIEGTSEKVYVVTANSSLSPELIKNAYLPQESSSEGYVLPTFSDDSYDEFPSHAFLADYVLLSDPFVDGYTKKQQVSFQLFELFMNDPIVKDYYSLKTVYREQGGNIFVFERNKPMDKSFVETYVDQLSGYYPEDAKITKPDYFAALFGASKNTDYLINPYWNNTLTFQKEQREDVEFSWDALGRDFKTLEFSLSCWHQGMKIHVEDQDENVLYSGEVAQTENDPYSINVSGCESVKVTISESLEIEHTELATIILKHDDDGLR